MMDQSLYQTLKFDYVGRVLTIAINLPERLNVVTEQLHNEMARVFHEAAFDPDSDVVVLTGVGRVFCAGGDLQWLADELRDGLPPFVAESHVMRRIVGGLLECPKPVIAKVNGDAIGFGASIALLCDIVIAGAGVRFADPHCRLGLSTGDGGSLIWPQLIGYAKAKHYLLTGDALDATEAERIGLISMVKPAEELDAFVAGYAARLATGAQTAIRYSKITTNIPLRQMAATVYEAMIAYEGLCKHSSDYREGVTAFVEKRKPVFTGR
ncbi:enoyl-CoA hydratase/isomerase family protein [Rhizorhabdus argentea]|uniref:enoyl-CoA hydratase/isomerase family protein n=1 Tax=Rhizorhabdus argentea TaxID=1387174 RepID=UPI0030EB1270